MVNELVLGGTLVQRRKESIAALGRVLKSYRLLTQPLGPVVPLIAALAGVPGWVFLLSGQNEVDAMISELALQRRVLAGHLPGSPEQD